MRWVLVFLAMIPAVSAYELLYEGFYSHLFLACLSLALLVYAFFVLKKVPSNHLKQEMERTAPRVHELKNLKKEVEQYEQKRQQYKQMPNKDRMHLLPEMKDSFEEIVPAVIRKVVHEEYTTHEKVQIYEWITRVYKQLSIAKKRELKPIITGFYNTIKTEVKA